MGLCCFDPLPEKKVMCYNMLQLAYLGDSVWEVIIRNELLRRGLNVHHMHSFCIQYVSARAQASFVQMIYQELSDEEQAIIRKGRNAHSHHPVPKNQNPEDYSISTGFEALIGFLFLAGKAERILQIARMIVGGDLYGRTKKNECNTTQTYIGS